MGLEGFRVGVKIIYEFTAVIQVQNSSGLDSSGGSGEE